MAARVSDATAAIQAKHRAVVRRRILRVTVSVLAVLLVLGAVWAVWFSPWFVVRSVEVSGVAQSSDEEIVTAAAIDVGTPLARLDIDAIRSRILAVSTVASVEIGRELSGVVAIAVTERTGVYTVPTGNQFVVVDASGLGYLTVPERRPELPLVDLVLDESPQATRLMADAAVIAVALPVSVRDQMAVMTAQTPDTFTITLVSGAQIMWGSAEESETKAEVIDGLLKVPASYYDISSPAHPATR